jgi:hypothetical protein
MNSSVHLHLVDASFAGGAYARRYHMAKKGARSHPHRHTVPHFTVAAGALIAYREWQPPVIVPRGSLIWVPANKLHQYEAAEDDVWYVCTMRLRYADGRYVEDDHGMTPEELEILVNNMTVREPIPGVHVPAA